MAWLKKYWYVVAIAAAALLYMLLRSRPGPGITSEGGYPNEERASAHFTWKELLGDGWKYNELTQYQKDFCVALARFAELARSLNGQKPLYCGVNMMPADETDDYVATFTPANGQAPAELQKAVIDAVANMQSYSHAVNFAAVGTGTRVFGDSKSLIDAVASGAAKV